MSSDRLNPGHGLIPNICLATLQVLGIPPVLGHFEWDLFFAIPLGGDSQAKKKKKQ